MPMGQPIDWPIPVLSLLHPLWRDWDSGDEGYVRRYDRWCWLDGEIGSFRPFTPSELRRAASALILLPSTAELSWKIYNPFTIRFYNLVFLFLRYSSSLISSNTQGWFSREFFWSDPYFSIIMKSTVISLLAGVAFFAIPTLGQANSGQLCSTVPPPPCLVSFVPPHHIFFTKGFLSSFSTRKNGISHLYRYVYLLTAFIHT